MTHEQLLDQFENLMKQYEHRIKPVKEESKFRVSLYKAIIAVAREQKTLPEIGSLIYSFVKSDNNNSVLRNLFLGNLIACYKLNQQNINSIQIPKNDHFTRLKINCLKRGLHHYARICKCEDEANKINQVVSMINNCLDMEGLTIKDRVTLIRNNIRSRTTGSASLYMHPVIPVTFFEKIITEFLTFLHQVFNVEIEQLTTNTNIHRLFYYRQTNKQEAWVANHLEDMNIMSVTSSN